MSVKRPRKGPDVVLLYSVSLHCWEAWSQSRPLGHGSLEACQESFPEALPVTETQLRLAAEDPRAGDHNNVCHQCARLATAAPESV